MHQKAPPTADGTQILDPAAAPDAAPLEAPSQSSAETTAMEEDQQLAAEPEALHVNSENTDQVKEAPISEAEPSTAALSADSSLASSVEPTLDDVAMLLEPASLPAFSTTTDTLTTFSLPLAADAEFFKVPFAPTPAAATLHGLPADIEHILSLGANEPDPEEEAIAAGKASNYEQVVREMREKAGFASKVEGEQGGELEKVQKEMEESGVLREVKVEEGEEGMEEMLAEASGVAAEAKKPVFTTMDDSTSSSDSSSDSSDSDAAVAASMRPTPATSSDTRKTRNRKRPTRTRAASVDSDLSDDDVNGGTGGEAPKTEHELTQPEIQLPKIQRLPEDAEISKFGKVESVIDTVVVVRADTAGDWRVLDEGSLCCWEDRTVFGNIFETFGSVTQPFYSLRFPASALPDPTVFTVGKAVYYCPKMASFVFTRDLRAMKGSDASNVWDEEVGAAEMEWSDDEAEQEYKRSQKAERRSRTASATPGPSSRQAPRAPSRAPSASPFSHLPARPPPSALPYDDEVYTPLQRPRDVHLIGEAPPPAEVGRRMFERDTGKSASAGGGEFEFSDDDETGSVSSTLELDERYADEDRGARGGRGRGGERGRGRGGSERGRGARGGTERGRGRGRGNDGGGRGRGGDRDARPVAPLPRSMARPAGLPQKPDFEPSSTSDGLAGANSSSFAGAGVPPPSFGFGAPPPSFQLNQPRSPPQQNQAYQSFNPSLPGGFKPSFASPTGFHQQQQFGNFPPQYPQQFQPPPPQRFGPPSVPSGASSPSLSNAKGPIPVQGGHFNPRFFANQQQQGFAPPQGPPQQQLFAFGGQFGGGQGQQYPMQQQGWQGGGFGGPQQLNQQQGPGRGGYQQGYDGPRGGGGQGGWQQQQQQGSGGQGN